MLGIGGIVVSALLRNGVGIVLSSTATIIFAKCVLEAEKDRQEMKRYLATLGVSVTQQHVLKRFTPKISRRKP